MRFRPEETGLKNITSMLSCVQWCIYCSCCTSAGKFLPCLLLTSSYFIHFVSFPFLPCLAYLEQGLLVVDSHKMALKYIRSNAFKLDVVSLIPLDWLYAIPVIGPAHTIVRLNRVLRLHRMIQFFDRTESRTNWPNVFRIVMLVLYIGLIIHWNACFYFLISNAIGPGSDQWVYPDYSTPNVTDDSANNSTNGTGESHPVLSPLVSGLPMNNMFVVACFVE